MLFLSSRSENISLIKKNYNKKIILIDRFTDSTIAYQHYGMGVNLKLINVFYSNFYITVLFFEFFCFLAPFMIDLICFITLFFLMIAAYFFLFHFALS